MTNIILPIVYAGNLQYFKLLLNTLYTIQLDIHEHFIKQTYRNRAEINGTNGMLSLIIPLEKRKDHTPMKEVKISYAQDWQSHHWKSLESAYRSSPYFEFYEYKLKRFYDKTTKPAYLIDYNLDLMECILDILKVKGNYTKTKQYTKDQTIDYRTILHPKNRIQYSSFQYPQVFDNHHDFIPNLSIFDLLFNEGPNASSNFL